MHPLIGYGPRQCLLFECYEVKYELWGAIFLGYMRLHKLNEVITSGGNLSDEAKHADVFTEWVQCLMNKTINLREHDFRHKRELYVQ